MFASWKKAGRLSLAVMVGAVALLASPSAEALEGIQGRHAIFYPSLELIYQHDDNFFLRGPGEDKVSADTFIARANFRVEVPGARQYLRLQYSPMYRDVDAPGYELPDSDSHYWDLLARLRGSSIFSVDVKHHFALANIESYELDPNRAELPLGSDARFWNNSLDVWFNWEGSRQGATLQVGHQATEFDDLTRAPAWFELDEIRFDMSYFYKFTPLTKFRLGYGYADGRQDFTPKAVAVTGAPSLDTGTSRVFFGFEGELGRTTTGQAQIAFVARDYDGIPAGSPIDPETADWDGVNIHAELTKAFSRYSKLSVVADRALNFSAFGTNTHYVSNRLGFTFSNQPQGGRVGWSLYSAYQRDAWDQEDTDAAGVFHEREDDVLTLRAEVGYHPLEHLSFRINYRYEERDSNYPEHDYTDGVVIFQVQFGF